MQIRHGRLDPLEPADESALREALAAAAAIPMKKRSKVTLRLVGRQAAAIKPAAGCGPSGWRNSYILCAYSDPDGPRALAEWSSRWARGAISPWLASLWSGALALPFFKTALCESVRTILQGEALLKFAMGTCLLGAGMQVADAVGERRHGAGRCAGAQLEVAEAGQQGGHFRNMSSSASTSRPLSATCAEPMPSEQPLSRRPEIRRWLCVDDWLLQVPLAIAAQLLAAVEAASAARDLALQLAKCAFHVPALAGTPLQAPPGDARALAARVPYRPDGLSLLGAEARGDQRLNWAIRLADNALEMMRLAPPACDEQAAFALRRGIVAHALDYDAGVALCSAMLPRARVLDQCVAGAVAASIDARPEQLAEVELQHIGLQVWFDGLHVDMPSRIAPLARATRLVEHGPALRAEVASWAGAGGEAAAVAREVKKCDGVDDAVSDGILDVPLDRGVAALAGRGRLASDPAERASDPLCTELYFDLKRMSSRPFGLTPRARLALEPPELHDWGRRCGELVLRRQALRAAERLGLACAAERARRAIEPEALQLAVLQCPGKTSEAARLTELCGVRCSADVEEELRRLTGERQQKRAAWWRHLRGLLSEL
ncbi:unnamed protein product [Prorocentrum cordatum]|uniref:Uncharacterized protein n=1 Tax=Prorocentrum cordatum TaxID=2364126 RepID=A0ABN9S9M9_9DINO|nr:unnamed protein product [Polarella glacialis]